MLKKVVEYIFVIIGFLSFLAVGGGSLRYRNRNVDLHSSLTEDVVAVVLIILIPLIGYRLIKLGYKILESVKE